MLLYVQIFHIQSHKRILYFKLYYIQLFFVITVLQSFIFTMWPAHPMKHNKVTVLQHPKKDAVHLKYVVKTRDKVSCYISWILIVGFLSSFLSHFLKDFYLQCKHSLGNISLISVILICSYLSTGSNDISRVIIKSSWSLYL